MVAPLSASQRARFRKAHREACAAEDQMRALNSAYAKFEELYGVSHDTLLGVAIEDQKRYPAEYAALAAIRLMQHQKPVQQQKRVEQAAASRTAPKKPEHQKRKRYGVTKTCPVCCHPASVDGHGSFQVHDFANKRKGGRCPGSGTPTKNALRIASTRSVRGGLPGLGKGHR